MHGKQIGIEDAFMGMNDIDTDSIDLSCGKPRKAPHRYKSREGDDRDPVKKYLAVGGAPSVGKNMHFEIGILGDSFCQFINKFFPPTYSTIFGDNHTNL
ncbi:hypothetical protein DSCW_67190 [Desulfosarcina widdelii]|uniref:Uncharacterized protein n=1 Tax=Desulfosarcina widdelii TaxID=947919 RepID=A0A5K7ZB61_9BACT|nr:hypothetical protein DSCW_67190 [Desulfosarcina widdelii]